LSQCKSCGGSIIWAIMPSGKRCPFDAEPLSEGSPRHGAYVLFPGTRRTIADDERRAVPLADWKPAPLPEGTPPPVHRAHFATCPQAAQHRHRKVEGGPTP